MQDRKLISVVVPVFNEEANVEPLYRQLTLVLGGLIDRYDYEILFTDNHSSDRTFEVIEELAAADPRIRALRFSKNFGFQRSILTGYMHSRGDAVIQIDCDLQDPPSIIPLFIEKWEAGNDVVFGIRRSRQEPFWMRWTRAAFYRMIDWLSEDDLPHDAGDFRLVSRRVVDVMREVDDYHPYLRGLIAGFGFPQVGIPYDRAQRERGESKFGFWRLLSLALDGILVHSVMPLRIATITGLIMALIMFGGVVVYLVGRALYGDTWPSGFATTTLLLLLSIILNALFLGVIGEYLGRMYQQIKKRPLTIVERSIDSQLGDQ